MEQDIKKLVLGDCEVTVGCQVTVDIVKVSDTIKELDLPENTNSDPVSPLKRTRKRDHQQHCEVLPRRSDAP